MSKPRLFKPKIAYLRECLEENPDEPIPKPHIQEILLELERCHSIMEMISAIPANLFVINKDNQYHMINHADDYMKHRFNRATLKAEFTPETEAMLADHHRQVLSKPGSHIFVEYDHANNNHYLSIKRRTYDINGKVNGLSGAAIPFDKTHQLIESLKDTAEQQAELIEKKDQFLQSAFHDIRGPLTGFYGLVESIKAQCPDSIRTEVQELSQYLDRYLSMVDDILTDKILGIHEEAKTCMISDSIDSIIALYQINAQQKGLIFKVSHELPPQLCIHARCDSIKRVLMNLITNAIKFTNQGSIELRCHLIDATDTDATLCCEVHDTGIGIKPDDLSRIFEKYYRTETSGRYPGTGIGLHTCHEAIMAMGGHLDVSSTYGVGSSFSCHIPVRIVAPPAQKIPAKTPETTAALNAPLSIIAVDDDAFARKALSIVLKQHWPSAELLMVDCYQALEKACQQQHFDVAFLDLGLPDVSGTDYIKTLVNHYSTHSANTAGDSNTVSSPHATPANTLWVVLSGQVSEALRHSCLQAGADMVITKPLRPDSLRTIAHHYQNKQTITGE